MLKLQAIGNLGNDARVQEVSNGRKAISFSIAENEKWTDQDGVTHEKTTWVNCTIWRNPGQSVEVAKWLKKGTLVYVEGKPEVSMYTNNAGEKAIDFKMQVATVQLLGQPKDQAPAPAPAPAQATRPAAPQPPQSAQSAARQPEPLSPPVPVSGDFPDQWNAPTDQAPY